MKSASSKSRSLGRRLWLPCALWLPLAGPLQAAPPELLVAVGAGGEEQFEAAFVNQAETWEAVAKQAGLKLKTIGLAPASEGESGGDLDQLLGHLAKAAEPGDDSPLWLVLIGHGTFDGLEARFNLRGPDLTAAKLAEALKPVARPVVVINTTSSSAPFLPALAGKDRIVVTATRSGSEENFTRFGSYLAEALLSLGADLDKDGQVSLLEAFLRASSDTAAFYTTENRLATEHALLDDNGDGLGTPADWYEGIRPSKKPADAKETDGSRAHQIHLVPSPGEALLTDAQRETRRLLEAELDALRAKRKELGEAAYLEHLEPILSRLADIYLPPPTPPPHPQP